MPMRQSALSLQFVGAYVTALVNGATYNPTSDAVAFAFTASGVDPQVSDWVAGAWETVAGPPTQYKAKCRVGPGGTITLGKGLYDVWVKVTDSPEVPVLSVDTLQIF